MKEAETQAIMQAYMAYLKNKEFPCIAAKAAFARQQVRCKVFDNMASANDDDAILQFLYDCTDDYRSSKKLYYSTAILFREPEAVSEHLFDELLWCRLQALANLDATKFCYDQRVNYSPSSPSFSFSIREEAFYIIGLHRNSSRQARKFEYPALVFNPHAQFEELRGSGKYEIMKNAVRKRDIACSGSVNPMLEDFGVSSEVYQYSGRKYDNTWQCPLKINHAAIKNNSTA